jgi:hypothetical protein
VSVVTGSGSRFLPAAHRCAAAVSFGAMADQLPDPTGKPVVSAPDAGAVYEAVSARRISFDQMMWQVPALSLTAQAFLVAIAVNTDLNRVVRVLAILLATVSGALAMQLMAKQRFHEQVDTAYLNQWEQSSRLFMVMGFTPHDHAIASGKAEALGITPNRWVRASSYLWWMWGLRLFMISMTGLLIWILSTS